MLYDSAEGKPIQSSKNDDDQASYNVICTFICNVSHCDWTLSAKNIFYLDWVHIPFNRNDKPFEIGV